MSKNYDAIICALGNYDKDSGSYGYGLVVRDKSGVHYLNGAKNDGMSSLQSIAGELAGASAAVQYCKDNDIKSANILYRYSGVEAWANGTWRAKNEYSKSYRYLVESARENMDIDFTHISKAPEFNDKDMCDVLTNAALGWKDSRYQQSEYKDALSEVVSCSDMLNKNSRVQVRDELLSDLGIISDKPSSSDSKLLSDAVKTQDETRTNYDAVIYVDGSFDKPSERYAYGMKIMDKSGTHYFNKAYPKDDSSSMRNVAGEIAGAKAAIQYCLDNDYKNVHILYDYQGIESWATGSWQAKNVHTQAYRTFCENAREHLNIDFTHVKGHTGVDGNEVCDTLAKAALGIPDTKAKMELYKDAVASAKPYVSKPERAIMAEWSDRLSECDDMSQSVCSDRFHM